MMLCQQIWTFVVILSLASDVKGHGRLWNPAGRASAWRFGFGTPANYNDNQNFCGGFGHQSDQGGKCGICGDPFDGPLKHEIGGIYANNVITRTYVEETIVDVSVQITASHDGWFEFRICPYPDATPTVEVTQSCLDMHLLRDSTTHETRFGGIDSKAMYNYTLQLPAGLTCDMCLLQWKYNTGNSWGVDPLTGEQGIGLGPQEQFYGCADVSIQSKSSPTPSPSPQTQTPSTQTPTPTPQTQTPSTQTPTSTPQTHTPSPQTLSPSSHMPSITGAPTPPTLVCHAVPPYNGNRGMDVWCNRNCKYGFCPRTHCACATV